MHFDPTNLIENISETILVLFTFRKYIDIVHKRNIYGSTQKKEL